MISKRLRKLAVDSNVLLSAVIGKAALKVLIHPSLDAITTDFNLKEVEEYLPYLAHKYRLDQKLLLLQLRMFPIVAFAEQEYQDCIPRAKQLVGTRDPDDVHLMALALKKDAAIWSNDKDFRDLPIQVYNTAQILEMFEV